MVPTKMNQNWLPSIFNDFFNNERPKKANHNGIIQISKPVR